MNYRLAKLKDLNSIVNLHYAVRKNYTVGIFATLDRVFLKRYYRILLQNVNFIIVCAQNDNGKLLGFCSSTIDIEDQMRTLNKNKVSLGLSAIPSILKKPSIILSLISRFKSINNKGDQFISKSGARLEYWVWSKDSDDSVSSLIMHEALLNIVKSLGISEINFEVDTSNKNVLKFHKINGAIELKRIFLEDDRERSLLKYSFMTRKTRVKLYKNNN